MDFYLANLDTILTLSFTHFPLSFLVCVRAGLCMSLQAKVAFFHHQWAWPHYLVMFISVGGMFLYFLMVAVAFDDYYYVAHHVFNSSLFWLFGFFFMPIVAVFIDWIGFYGKLLVYPTREMLYREFEHSEEFNNLQMMTCLDRRAGTRPLSSEKRSFYSNNRTSNGNSNNSGGGGGEGEGEGDVDDTGTIEMFYPVSSTGAGGRISPSPNNVRRSTGGSPSDPANRHHRSGSSSKRNSVDL